MTDDRLDLSPLDPASDPERWERFVDRVATDAARRVASRAPSRAPSGPGFVASVGITAELARWARPSLAAAAVLVVASAASLASDARQRRVPPAALGAALLHVPAPVRQWMSAARAPDADEVYAGLAGRVSP